MLVAFARATSGRARAGLIAAGTVALALIAATVVAVLPWWTAWLRGLTTTLDALLGPAGAIVLVTIIATAIGVGLTLPARGPATLAMWIATAILIAPYVQAYDHLLLLPPLAVATSAAAARSRRASIVIGLAGVALLIFGDLAANAVAMARGHDLFGATIPFLIWALVTAAAWTIRATASR